MEFFVKIEDTLDFERLFAELALELPVARMKSFMILQIFLRVESFEAELALVVLGASVSGLVTSQIKSLTKVF